MAKKTKEEQQEELDKTIAEAERLKDIPVEDDQESDEAKALQEEQKKNEDEPEEAEEVDPEESEVEEAEEPQEEEDEPETPEVDYKKKFSESSRNAQKIAAKNKKINEAIDEAGEIDQPTDDEMKVEFPDWDIMEDFSKKLAIESTMGKRFRENLSRAREEGQKIEKWNEQVDEFTEDPETLTKNPDLEGRIDEFKIYATDDANTSIPFDVLVPAFLHNSNIKAKNKGNMFPTGSAGPSDKGTPKTPGMITVDEGIALMKSNYDKYKEKLLAGLIETGL